MIDNRKIPHFMTPGSPPYAPFAAYIDSSNTNANVNTNGANTVNATPAQLVYNTNDPNSPPTAFYVYPLSPQFSVQYYSTNSNNIGSPLLLPHITTTNNNTSASSHTSTGHTHRHQHHHQHQYHQQHHHYTTSPPLHPISPPFSPTLQYHHANLSPQTHATTFVLPPHQQQHFPPLHMTSPILTATTGSPPPLPLTFIHQQQHSYDIKKRQEQLEHEYAHLTQFHPQNIYVRGLPVTETDESFLELCQAYGPITSSKAIIDQKTGECKGYGFAMFEDQKDCQLAINRLNAAGYQAYLARVGQESFSSKLRSLQDETSTNIYISNLPVDMNEENLEELFKPFQIVSNRILRDPQSGMSRGVGFARLANRSSASTIIEKFNGHSIIGSSAPLQVRFADSPAQKRLKNQTSSPSCQNNNRNTTIIKNGAELFHYGFPVMNERGLVMPATPETILGIAPSVNNAYSNNKQDVGIDEAATDAVVDSLAIAVGRQLDLDKPTLTTAAIHT